MAWLLPGLENLAMARHDMALGFFFVMGKCRTIIYDLYLYVYMYICKHVYMYICIYVYTYICIYIYVYMYICIDVYMYIYMYICINV